ncbi:molybdenum cofactor guanylyltransferase [Marinobacter halodurans]|uniref:Molybdenum cofactor guanylyltransferase n=1 Tax=Marinobacter halodurans TaxID=2528979 RepID=A0ABY1ZRA2_9GAMM|nr:molybdenum cofactor guanylyltransferase MobA [Marinobacter halodurans]TBW58196.1 molybdenum cofactor guanylyltransferase [Marinobacter halodurans]
MPDPDTQTTLCGLILAGGRARRLGGVEKGLADWQGRPLVATAVDALRPHCGALLISANRRLPDYRPWADRVVSDAPEFDDAGPLAGLLAGLRSAQGLGLAGVLVMPCDTPAVSAGIMGELAVAARQDPQRIVLARVSDRLHPLHGYYPAGLDAALQRYLEQGGRKVMGFAEAQQPRYLDLPIAPEVFRNLNAPEDWGPSGAD